MIRRLALTATTLLATLVPLAAGCGGSTKSNAGPTDAGGAADVSTKDAGKDAPSASDGGGDDGGGLPPGAVAPHGTQLVMSGAAVINGVTSDGYAIYTDTSGTSATLNAVALAGGTPTVIGANDGSGGAVVGGPVAIAFNGVSQSTGGGVLGIWTSAHGMQTLSMAALAAGPGRGNLDVSADGKHILFLDNVTVASADVTVIDTDGTNKKVLVPGVTLADQTCFPFIGFAGAYAVVASCASAAGDAGAVDAGTAGDGGAAAPASFATFTGSAWATVGHISSAAFPGFASDAAGTQILYLSGAGLQVGTLATSASKTIDATGNNGLFTSNGQNVVYSTTGGNVMLAPAAGAGSPTTLQAGFPGLLALSPDDKWLLGYKAQTTTSAGDTVNDLYLSSATTAGTTALALSSTKTATLYGDAFTADSSHTMFANNVNMGAGDFDTAAVTGGTPTTQGMLMWINSSTTGAKTVFNINYNAGSASGGAADLMAADLSTSAAPTLLVTQADAYYYLTSAKDKVVYSWSYLPNSPAAGIWVLPLP